MVPKREHYDVIVVGGGPAGSATGVFLARRGYRCAILEAARFPRHHIGESLLPGSMPILAELGLSAPLMRKHHQPKRGARFLDPQTGRMATFDFSSPSDSEPPAYQVIREEFDVQLRDIALAGGCELVEDCRVLAVDTQAQAVRVSTATGTPVRCEFLVDATGAAALAARQERAPDGRPQMLPGFGQLAIYNYFDGLAPTEPHERAYITMHLLEHGWIWLIPLRTGFTSVGVVLKKSGLPSGRTPEERFWSAMRETPVLEARLRALTPADPYRAISNYSYRCPMKYGRRHIQVGDAAGFLDPIFSSGVHLALISAREGAAAVHRYLEGNSPEALGQYQQFMDAGIHVFESFVHRFYQRDLVRNLFFADHQPPAIRAAIIGILTGQVWDTANPLVASLENARRTVAEADASLSRNAE